MDYNSMAFTPDEAKQKLHTKLVEYLIEFNSISQDYINDILITHDGYCTIVKWYCRNRMDEPYWTAQEE